MRRVRSACHGFCVVMVAGVVIDLPTVNGKSQLVWLQP